MDESTVVAKTDIRLSYHEICLSEMLAMYYYPALYWMGKYLEFLLYDGKVFFKKDITNFQESSFDRKKNRAKN